MCSYIWFPVWTEFILPGPQYLDNYFLYKSIQKEFDVLYGNIFKCSIYMNVSNYFYFFDIKRMKILPS